MFTILVLHVLGATIWTGGHLLLAFRYLPEALKTRNVVPLQAFESKFEIIGIPALVIQVVTGILLARFLIPDTKLWIDFQNPVARTLMIKLGLLGLTVLLAIDARLRVIPKLSSETVSDLAWHIIPVTIVSVLFVILGISFRFGGY